jgi:hypothetical protein
MAVDFNEETKRMVDSWYGHPLSNHLANNIGRKVFMKDIPALLKWVHETAIAAERERCAKVADEWAADGDWDPDCCRGIAAQIRDPDSSKAQF